MGRTHGDVALRDDLICDSAASTWLGDGRHNFPAREAAQELEGAVAAWSSHPGGSPRSISAGFSPDVWPILIARLSGLGQLGDLTESLLKRDAGSKTRPLIRPRGAFDRFDSVLLSRVCYLIRIFPPR